MPVIEAEAAVDCRDLRLDGAFIREKQPRRAAFDDGGRDIAAVNVRERLRGEDDGSVLLPECLQPFAELIGEPLIIERQPALVDDEQGWPTIEPVADPMKQIGQDGRRSPSADQPLDLEGLYIG